MSTKPLHGPLGLLLAVLLGGSFPAAAAAPLSLDEALALSLERDPAVARHRDGALARMETADAAGRLPNPSVFGEALNVPVDGRIDDDPMTQFRIGLRQAFPRGESRRLASQREQALARGDRARASDAERQTRRAVRQVYLELVYQRQTLAVLADNRDLFEDLLAITQREYAAGTVSQQDVLQAELELERLDDRIDTVRTREVEMVAEFGRWVGPDAAQRELPLGLPRLTPSAGDLSAHPLLAVDAADLAGSQYGTALARQGFRPQWGVQVVYGRAPGVGERGNPDRVSAMVTVDLPLFSRQRVTSEVAAEDHRRDAVLNAGIERERQLASQLSAAQSRRHQMSERERRFDERLLGRAREHAEVTEQAYRAGTADFTSLMRARVMDLETRLNALRVSTDLLQVEADLLYLLGEEAS